MSRARRTLLAVLCAVLLLVTCGALLAVVPGGRGAPRTAAAGMRARATTGLGLISSALRRSAYQRRAIRDWSLPGPSASC